MSFTFTPVVAGNPIDAQPLQDVFDNLQAYINGGVVAGDLANNTLQKHHIMKGTYQPLPNAFNFVSGICGGQSFTSAEEKLSFMAGTTTQPINGNVARKYYPTTSMTFYVEKECTAFFQFFACPLMFNFAFLLVHLCLTLLYQQLRQMKEKVLLTSMLIMKQSLILNVGPMKSGMLLSQHKDYANYSLDII